MTGRKLKEFILPVYRDSFWQGNRLYTRDQTKYFQNGLISFIFIYLKFSKVH